jgi:hypothetical protein
MTSGKFAKCSGEHLRMSLFQCRIPQIGCFVQSKARVLMRLIAALNVELIDMRVQTGLVPAQQKIMIAYSPRDRVLG